MAKPEVASREESVESGRGVLEQRDGVRNRVLFTNLLLDKGLSFDEADDGFVDEGAVWPHDRLTKEGKCGDVLVSKKNLWRMVFSEPR